MRTEVSESHKKGDRITHTHARTHTHTHTHSHTHTLTHSHTHTLTHSHTHTLTHSHTHTLTQVRSEVSESHQKGDRILAQFSNLLAAELLEGAYEVSSSVTATADGAEFSLSESVAPADLTHGTLGLATRQLDEVMVRVGGDGPSGGMGVEFASPRLAASAVEFGALRGNMRGVHRYTPNPQPLYIYIYIYIY